MCSTYADLLIDMLIYILAKFSVNMRAIKNKNKNKKRKVAMGPTVAHVTCVASRQPRTSIVRRVHSGMERTVLRLKTP